MRLIVFLILCTFLIPYGFSRDYLFNDSFSILGEWNIVYGDWIVKEGLLIQNSTKSTITHITRIVKQEGVMEYEFACTYIRGLEDNYGGFGIHLCIDTPTHSRSWGMNKSYLFWITFDPAAYKREDCFFLQVYKSTSPIHMDFLHDTPGDAYPLDPQVLSPKDFIATAKTGELIKLRFQIDTKTGQGKFYHPGDETVYFPFDLQTEIEPGMYIGLRTNSISIGVGYVAVRSLE